MWVSDCRKSSYKMRLDRCGRNFYASVMATYPHWVDRRRGWEPVNKMSKPKKPLRFEYWKSRKNNEWYWRVVAKNGRIVAVGGESFKRRAGVLNAFHSLFDFEAAPVIEELFNSPAQNPKKPKNYEGPPRSGKWP